MTFGHGRRRGAGGAAPHRALNAVGSRRHLTLPPRRPDPVAGPYSNAVGDETVRSLPELVLEELAQQVAASAPIGELTLWAIQDGEANFSAAQTQKKYLAYPVDPKRLTAAQQAAFGQPIPFVAVISDQAMLQSAIEAAWDGSPYEDAGTEVVYREDDPQEVPTGYFVHWGNLRGDQINVDYSKLGTPTIALRGTLVYLLPAPITGQERPYPHIPFSTAWSVREGVVEPTTDTTSQTDMTMVPDADGSVVAPASPNRYVQAAVIAVITGGSVVLGYQLVSSMRSKA
jgi:hypothetical protein